MADVKKCDRCGAYYEPTLEARLTRLLYRFDIIHKEIQFDLCKECQFKFASFMMDPGLIDLVTNIHSENKDEAP